MALEDTTKTMEQENKDLLAQIATEVKSAPEPGQKVGDVVETVGEVKDMEIPMVIQSVDSAGYAYLWNTRTGDRSKFNRNMLPRVLKQKWNDDPLKGKLVWSVREVPNPPFPVKIGTLKCLLHKDDKNRSKYNEMGFAICPKDCLASPYQVRRHMMKKHKDEWAAIEDMRKEEEKKKADDRQEAQTKAMLKLAKRK